MNKLLLMVPAAAGVIAAALPATGSGVPTHQAATTTRATAAAAVADPVITQMRSRYTSEVSGSAAKATLARLVREPGLVAAVRSQSDARIRAYVASRFRPVWYHWHVSRMRITRGSTTIVETGVPFVVDGPTATVHDAGGKALAKVQISIQDVIGYVRLNKRHPGLDTVVRGQGAAHVRTSLPAALKVKLPSNGNVTIAGRRYHATSFDETGWKGEPLTIWILS
jgi:hypothetical protein